MEKPVKKKRKNQIKDQNAEKKRARIPRDPKTPEELERQMEGFTMIVLGFLKIAGVDPSKLIKGAEEFPSEIDLDAPS